MDTTVSYVQLFLMASLFHGIRPMVNAHYIITLHEAIARALPIDIYIYIFYFYLKIHKQKYKLKYDTLDKNYKRF